MPVATRTSKPAGGAPVSVAAGRRVGPKAKTPTAGVAAIPHGPAIKLKANPALKDPRFTKVMAKLQKSAHKVKQHPPPSQKAGEAQAAATPPANEKLAGAQANNVDAMKGAPTKKPENTSFLEMLRAEIQKTLPKKTEDGEDFMKGNDKQQLKSAMTGNISQQKQEAAGGMKAASDAPPDTSRVPGKEVTPLAAVPDPVPAPAIGAADAMPAPKPDAEVSLEQGKKDADKAMSDNKLTTPQLQKANDPRFSAVLTAKSKVETAASTLPQQYRATETKVIAQNAAQAVAGEHRGFAAFKGLQGKSGTAVRGHQLTAKEKDEARRKAVTDHIESIFAKTKTAVDQKLERLDTEVSDMFDAGTEAAIAVMKDYVETRFDDRYSGIRGKARWVKDKFWPLPDSVKVWFDESFVVFQQSLDDLVVRVANLVETRLREAKDEVAKGQKEIAKYVAGLDPDLKAVGQAAEKDVKERFDDLRQSIEDKKTDLAQNLAQRYKDAYDKGAAALQAIKDAHKSLVERVVDAIKEVVEVLRNFKNRIMAMIKKAAEAIDLIISDPIGFLSNLLDAIKLGISQFRDHIWEHLQEGFLAWLFGTLGDAGITLPKSFSPGSILLLVLSILGITYAKLRAKAVKLIGPRAVTAVETVSKVLYDMVTVGPEKLWEEAKEFLGNLKDTIIEGIKEWAITAIIKAAVMKLATMFNPVGAIIQAILAIYRTVIFFVERINQILDFVQAILDSVLDIAKGNISSAANWIEKALARAIPIIISFLAALLGLSGISGKIKEIVKKLQSTVEKAMDLVIAKLVAGFKKLFGKDKTEVKGDALESARRTLATRLDGSHSREQAQAIISEVKAELEGQGLKRLELKPLEEAGEFVIIAEASPPEEVMRLGPVPKKGSKVVMGTSFRLSGDDPLLPDKVPGTTKWSAYRLRGARGATMQAAAIDPAQSAPSTWAKSVAGGRIAKPIAKPTPDPTADPSAESIPEPLAKPAAHELVHTVTWSTGDDTHPGDNATHAERQLVDWFDRMIKEHPDWKNRITEVDILISESPCKWCALSLCHFKSQLSDDVKAKLKYTYVHQGANPTTAADIEKLESCNWRVGGPAVKGTKVKTDGPLVLQKKASGLLKR